MDDPGQANYRRFLEGDESALFDLVERYNDGLVLYLNSFVGSLAVAGELLESRFLREEQKRRVHRAMGRLKPEYRQTLWLLYFEEMSGKEAAAVMRKSVHAVETLAYRARLALRRELEKEGIAHEDI